AALHPHRLAGDLLVPDLVLGLAVVAEELHQGALFIKRESTVLTVFSTRRQKQARGSLFARLKKANEVLLDRLPGGVVGGDGEGALPDLDRFVAKTGLLVQDREVLEGRKMTAVDVEGRLELLNGVVDPALLSVEQAEVIVEPISERVDPRPLAQVLD